MHRWRHRPLARASRVLSGLGAAALVALTALSPAAAASAPAAAPSWSVRTLLDAPGGTGRYELRSVTCRTATFCMAVGSSTRAGRAGAVAEPLAEVFRGDGWTGQLAAPPPLPAQGYLSGVSCASTASCVAVGWSFLDGASASPLVERWDDAVWSTEAVPAPPARVAYLSAVSCVGQVCQAVGYDQTRGGATQVFAVRSSGGPWTLERVPEESATFTVLNSVSCVTTEWCVAVGLEETHASRILPVAVRWDGVRWSALSVPAAPDMQVTVLQSVSCPAPTSCVAVGWENPFPSVQESVAARWDGQRWVQLHPAQFLADPTTSLLGVSCVTPASCTAVGSIETEASTGALLAEGWNAGRWSVETTPAPAASTSDVVSGVSCVASHCVAVGSYAVGARSRSVLLRR